MQDCGWALRYACMSTCKTCAKLGVVSGLKNVVCRTDHDFLAVFSNPVGQGKAESVSPASAHKHCRADAPKTGIGFADGGAPRLDWWVWFGFKDVLIAIFLVAAYARIH